MAGQGPCLDCPYGTGSGRCEPPETLVFVPTCAQIVPTAATGGLEMGSIERRNGRYRARYRDPLGRQQGETFSRKADAERFLREQQVEMDRGRWFDPRSAETPL